MHTLKRWQRQELSAGDGKKIEQRWTSSCGSGRSSMGSTTCSRESTTVVHGVVGKQINRFTEKKGDRFPQQRVGII